MIDKKWIPPPEAFILDKYEQQIEDDVAQGLYVPISKEDFFSKLKSWAYHQKHKKISKQLA
jgi:hypothetical protein